MPRKKVTVEQNENGTTVISGTADDINQVLSEAAKGADDKTIVIKGAALTDIFCHYSYDHTVAPGIVNSNKVKSAVPVHDDLKAKFRALRDHLAAICEELTEDQMHNLQTGHFHPEMSEAFSVSAFKIVGTGDSEGVVLIGEKKLSTGESVKLETPTTKWESNYSCVNELRIAIGDCIAEVEEYMNGKQAPAYVQQDLFDEENEEAV